MATNTDTDGGTADRHPTTGPENDAEGRYRPSWTDGELLIYDVDEESAWIQSASGIGLEFMR